MGSLYCCNFTATSDSHAKCDQLFAFWCLALVDDRCNFKNLHTSHREKKGKGQLLFASVVFVCLLKELLALKTCIVVYCLINLFTAMLAHSELSLRHI